MNRSAAEMVMEKTHENWNLMAKIEHISLNNFVMPWRWKLYHIPFDSPSNEGASINFLLVVEEILISKSGGEWL
jgi:hypothetical protein